jgi:hypothetical protein
MDFRRVLAKVIQLPGRRAYGARDIHRFPLALAMARRPNSSQPVTVFSSWTGPFRRTGNPAMTCRATALPACRATVCPDGIHRPGRE